MLNDVNEPMSGNFTVSKVPGRAREREERAMIVCYLCGEPVDASDGSGDHVIPRTLLGDRPLPGASC